MTITDITPVAAAHDTTTDNDQGPLGSYYEVLDKIVDETGCSRDDAFTAILFIEDMVALARGGERCNTPGTHHLTASEMAGTGYRIMDDIMPHGENAKPGSAHAAVERAILGSDEYAIVHDNPTGKPEDCVVSVTIRRMS
jgi:hypothetical protein